MAGCAVKDGSSTAVEGAAAGMNGADRRASLVLAEQLPPGGPWVARVSGALLIVWTGTTLRVWQPHAAIEQRGDGARHRAAIGDRTMVVQRSRGQA